jgi:hypothetical protein
VAVGSWVVHDVVPLHVRADPFLLPLRTAVSCTAEGCADEEAALAVGSCRDVAGAIGKAALVSRGSRAATLAGFAAAAPHLYQAIEELGRGVRTAFVLYGKHGDLAGQGPVRHR